MHEWDDKVRYVHTSRAVVVVVVTAHGVVADNARMPACMRSCTAALPAGSCASSSSMPPARVRLTMMDCLWRCLI